MENYGGPATHSPKYETYIMGPVSSENLSFGLIPYAGTGPCNLGSYFKTSAIQQSRKRSSTKILSELWQTSVKTRESILEKNAKNKISLIIFGECSENLEKIENQQLLTNLRNKISRKIQQPKPFLLPHLLRTDWTS